MKCLNPTELEAFLVGKLDPLSLLAVDEHIATCTDCRTAVSALPGRVRAGYKLGDSLLELRDCPEYEELSGFIDNSFEGDRANALTTHVNSCELCARDIAQISEMRSHAAMRETIMMRPGMTRQPATGLLAHWKVALAGVSTVAAVAVIAMSLGNFTGVAKHPSVNMAAKPQPKPVHVAYVPPTPAPSAPAKGEANLHPSTPGGPSYTTLLKDGSYQVIRKGHRMELADASGHSVKTALEARIAASINEKLRTGKITLDKPIQLAMNTVKIRGDEYTPPPTAPKTIAPAGKILFTAKPTFKWTKIDLAQSYHLTVTDKDGNIVTDQMVSKSSYTLTTPLRRGQIYRWQIGVRFGETDAWATSQAAGFKVLSAEDYASIQKVKTRLPNSHLALGAAYESFGLYDEAAGEYRALRQSNPGSALARKLAR